jgi:HK97 family phage major capsid protein
VQSPRLIPVFGQTTLGAFKYAGFTQVSQELLSDSLFNVAGFVADQGGRAVARGFGADLSNGSGSSKPKGVAQAATSFGTSVLLQPSRSQRTRGMGNYASAIQEL